MRMRPFSKSMSLGAGLVCGLIVGQLAFAATKQKGKSVSYTVAKKECLKQDPTLKKKALQTCIKNKRK